MRRVLAFLGILLTLALGVVAGIAASVGLGVGEQTETTTVTEMGETSAESAVPAAVESTRLALLRAAEDGNYEAVRDLIPLDGFEYTFGGPVEGGPVAYWQELERTTHERPLEILAAILEMPYTLSHGIYVWPFAYTLTGVDDLTPYERTLLTPLGDLDTLFAAGTGYLGWRAGIDPDGKWVFFVAGD